MVVSHPLVLRDRDSIVLQFTGVQELLQELSLPPPLLCQGGHLWGVLHSQLGMQKLGRKQHEHYVNSKEHEGVLIYYTVY